MKRFFKNIICAASIAAAALPMFACSAEQNENSFDDPLPWHDSLELAPGGSYERLGYSVAVYNTEKGTAEDKRVKIADGSAAFTLTEQTNGYATFGTDFSVTFLDNAPADEVGLTDTVTSMVSFENNSLATEWSYKSVQMATRAGKDNNSYVIRANYASDAREIEGVTVNGQKATMLYTAKDGATERTRSLPSDSCHDNEMMYMLARAQGLSTGSTNMFRMVNVFDSFLLGETMRYTMSAAVNDSKKALDIGDWVKDYGVEAVTDEDTANTTYPVSCYQVNIGINDEKHGPYWYVCYSEKPFTSGEKSHGKLPVKLSYTTYEGSKAVRMTEFVLSSCSFDKQ